MVEANVKIFLDSVKRGREGNKLKSSLLVSKPGEFMSWTDDSGLDALHHVILLNNPEAAQLLLSEGYFRQPYQPTINPYAHLASQLGYKTILSIILQYRPDDFLLRTGKLVIPDQENESQDLKTCPLEVAAKAKKIECVRTILNLCVLKSHPDAPSKDDVTLACLADSPVSLQLILKEKPKTSEIKSGVEISLQRGRPECLDILLQQGVPITSLFKHINFFHVLYTYSATFSKSSFQLLPKMTAVLIKHGHSVKASKPPRTYPLYSLLSHSFCISDYDNTNYYIKCMKMLLKEGADPCFDEVKDEEKQMKRGVKPAVGRHAFSSALHCLLETVETFADFLESHALAVKFVEECADILAQHKAHANQIGRVGGSKSSLRGTVLHQYAKCAAIIGVDDAIIKCLLRHGADPNEKVNGKYAINTYLDRLFEQMTVCRVVDTHNKHRRDVDKMLEICMFMSLSPVRECENIFKRDHSREITEQVKPYVKYVQDELHKRCHTIKSLRRIAAWEVWLLCNKKGSVVHSLPVSVKIKTDILPIV